jgi:hypothetical protein
MASTERDLVRELGGEREKLAEAVVTLRGEIDKTKDIGGKLKARLPVALGIGVLASGGIRAALRLLMRRARTGKTSSRARPARRRGGGRARSR